jgi:hypothetical protein
VIPGRRLWLNPLLTPLHCPQSLFLAIALLPTGIKKLILSPPSPKKLGFTRPAMDPHPPRSPSPSRSCSPQVPRPLSSHLPFRRFHPHYSHTRFVDSRPHSPLYKTHHWRTYRPRQWGLILPLRIACSSLGGQSAFETRGSHYWSIQVRSSLEPVSRLSSC